MNKPSRAQELFIRRLKFRRITVCAARVLILAGFLFLWEFCADNGIIDSFIFSSPSKIAACFGEMVADRSIFRHISITLYETLASFLLVFLDRGASEIATDFGLNEAFGDILTGIILFFIIGCEFFITYELHFRGRAAKEAAENV